MIKGTSNQTFLFSLFIMVISSACNKNVLFTDSVRMPEKEWTLENVPVFTTPISDTISANNLYFTIRTSSSYPFRNIYLFVTTTSPAGKTITDTLQYILADEKGKWYGKGVGDIHELNLPFKTNVCFNSKGIYSFKIQHGMRNETLKGFYDLGLRIEKIKN
jgi:gliding motility-associated lipoprotein GldH